MFALVCGTFLLCFQTYAETPLPPNGNCTYWHACESTQKSYFEFSEGTDLTTLEIGDLMYGKIHVRKEYVEQCYDEAAGLTVTRTLLNPEESLNEWMTPIYQSIISKNGVRMLDNQMQEIGNYPPSPLQSEHWSDMEQAIEENGFVTGVSFDYPTPADIAELQVNGFHYVEYTDGKFAYSNADQEVIVDPVNLQIEINEMEEGELIYSTVEGFIPAEGQGYYQSFSIQRAYQVLPSGTCGSFVTITNYHNVTTSQEVYPKSTNNKNLTTLDLESESGNNQIGTFEVFPNPTRDQVSVYLSNLDASNGVFSLKLFDLNGQVVLERSITDQNIVNLSLPDLPKGMYILNVSSDKQSISKKLMKN